MLLLLLLLPLVSPFVSFPYVVFSCTVAPEQANGINTRHNMGNEYSFSNICPLFASLAMRANVAVAADVDVAAAFAKAAHTLNIFNCCCCFCCCCCDAALFKLDVDHSFACFALYFLTLALELYAHTCDYV